MSGRPEDEPGSGTMDEARVEMRREGHVVAVADVRAPAEPHGTARVALRAEHDDVPPDARGDLVDQVLDSPGVSNSDAVHVVVPLGDSASITRLQQRTTDFTARAAGSSSVIDAAVAHPSPTTTNG